MYEIKSETKGITITIQEENLEIAKNIATNLARYIEKESEINVMNTETGEILLTLETKILNDSKIIVVDWDTEE